jgi:hypothetical protein|tara:strand:- start:154 stop:366 length:213 start_codon:yes stop_codon:yes gene_type:complete
MKLYRVQARHLGAYIDHQVSCDTEEQVIPNFINELNTGKVKIEEETLTQPKLCLVTYEELNDGIKTSTTS